jgi:selenocysteine lyase/cysteine desulfurase
LSEPARDLIGNQRDLFDIPAGVAFLNVATMGPLPIAACEAGQRGLARKLHPWTIPDADFFADTQRLRPLLAKLIGADEAGIAFVPSVSYGLATAARNLALEKGQKILLLADQFPSNVYTWREHARSNFALLPALQASVQQILDWGVANIEATLGHQNRSLAEALEERGLTTGPESGRGPHYLGALLPQTAPDDLTARLRSENIYVSKRGSRLRITPHLFTTQSDIARFLGALDRHLA